jgi:hypothetical protein
LAKRKPVGDKPKKKKEFILKAFLIAGLRRMTYRFPPRYNKMNSARVERGKYKCEICSNIVGRKDITLDHIETVVPLTGFPMLPSGKEDWSTYIERMFVDESGWQVICRVCDKVKLDKERVIRKANRDAKKEKKIK